MRERTMMRTEMTSDSGQGFTIVFLDVAIIKPIRLCTTTMLSSHMM